jgi:nucleoside-diphosphate-sugar epimerase
MPDQVTIAKKRVLVTGAGGFIGSHLCGKLKILGAEIHGISRAERPKVTNDMTWWTSNLQEEDEVHGLLKSIKPDIVYHLSSCVSGSRDPAIVLPIFRSNLVSTVTLLTALEKIGCERVVLAGSMEEPDSSQTDLSSISPYAASKWASSIYGRLFHTLYDLPVVILHVFMVYGPGQMDLKKLVPYVTLSFLRNEAPKLSSGSRQVDWIYIDDVVEGFISSAQAAGISGHTLDIGSGVLTSVHGIVEELRGLTRTSARPDFKALDDRPFENVRTADVKSSFELLGWRTQVSVQEGLRRTVSWYHEQLSKGERT